MLCAVSRPLLARRVGIMAGVDGRDEMSVAAPPEQVDHDKSKQVRLLWSFMLASQRDNGLCKSCQQSWRSIRAAVVSFRFLPIRRSSMLWE